MKKKIIIYSFILTGCMFNLLECIGQPYHVDFNNYITISNGEFKDGNSIFKPLGINYIVVYPFEQIDNYNRIYYISPTLHYSNIKRNHLQTGIYNSIIRPEDHWGYGDSGASERDSAGIKLENDLRKIDSLGFNVVRLNPSIYWNGDVLTIPTQSYENYFRLTDSLIAKCTQHGLRVIMVLSDDTNTYKQFDQFCVYLDSVTRHYSTNKTVMAYVVYMEPGYKWKKKQEKSVNDKLLISNWSRKWYHLVKKNAPNQLVSIELDEVNNVLYWDPSALTYDFLTMNFYHASSQSDSSKNAVHASFKWMNDNVENVWVIGETGFSGTTDSCSTDPYVGSELAQYQFAEYTMQKAISCGCKGYSWWQYQDVNWLTCLENHFGIYTYYPNAVAKSVASLFSSYPPQQPFNICDRPNCYYSNDIFGYPSSSISGVVLDKNSNPIKDAYVSAWSTSYKSKYFTFTDSLGRYTIYKPQDTVLRLVWLSQKGYTAETFNHVGTTNDTTRLTRINYNRWKKNWTNQNYPIPSDTFTITSQDIVVVGNFFGDEAQEMFLIRPLTQTASLYNFHIDHWERIWTGIIGDWTISSTDKFFAGDFTGNGYDDLLCVQNVSLGKASIFGYNPITPKTPWSFVWSNFGDGSIGNWNYKVGDVILPGYFNDSTYCSLMCIRNKGAQKNALCQRLSFGSWVSTWSATTFFNNAFIGSWNIGELDRYYVGDFSGDGIDEIFCVQTMPSSSSYMTLMQYSTIWNTLWTNNGQSEGIGIYPYRDKLHVGNFDRDRADELLGVGTWATKFDLNTSNQWDWSWSTYDSGKLSDWAVNPSHKILFMKVMSDVPDYLFVARGNSSVDFCFDAYSYDP